MAHAGEGKPEAKDTEESPERLNQKTWVLKVSIHCEACKKKVNKILHKIEGVYRTDFDLKQQRVTVTGNVEAETLIAKLEKKTHKRPSLLPPDKAPVKAAAPKEKKQSKAKPKDNQQSSNDDGTGGGEAEVPEGDDKAEKKPEPREPKAAVEAGGDGGSGKNGAGDVERSAGDGVEAKKEKGKQPEVAKERVTGPVGDQPSVPDKAAAEKVGDSEKSGGSAGGKKKKPKGKNGKSEVNREGKMGQDVSSGDAPVSSERSSDPGPSADRGPGRGPTNHIPLPQHFDAYANLNPYPPHYYHGPPMYAVSHHTAYPASTYGTSYYAPQPPPNSYAYVHPGQEINQASPYSDPYSHQRSDSFEMFSDENPNACSVM